MAPFDDKKNIILLWDIILASVICFPVFLFPTQKILGSENVDVWNHMWGAWWWKEQFMSGTLPYDTDLLMWPNGGVLWFIDPVLAFFTWPLTLLSPVLGYNLGVIAMVAFASFATRFFARSIGCSQKGEMIASIGVCCSAWLIGEIHNGISESVNIGFGALALALVERASQNRQTTKIHQNPWLWAGISVGGCFWVSPYLGLAISIASFFRSISLIKKAWFGGIVAIFIALPSILTLRGQLLDERAIIKKPDTMNETLALHNAVDPQIFFRPFGFQSQDLSAEGFYHSMYFGLVVLALAFPIFQIRKKWFVGAILCVIFSLGPYLYIDGGWYVISSSRLRLPWWFVQQAGLAITHPLRLAVPSLIIFSAFAGLQASTLQLRKYTIPLCLLVAIDGLLISGAPWPLATADATIPAVYQLVKEDQRDVGVLDLPTDSGSTMKASKYLYYQTYHSKPIPYAPDVRASTSSLLRNNAFKNIAKICRRRSDEQKALGFGGPQRGSQSLITLRDAKIGWIVLHKDIDPSVFAKLKSTIEKELGEGIAASESIIWKLDSQN